MHLSLFSLAMAFTLVVAQSGTDECGEVPSPVTTSFPTVSSTPLSTSTSTPITSVDVSTSIPSSSSVAPPSVPSLTSSSQAATQTGTSQGQFSETGQATFYTPGLGACGITNTVNDLIVAVSAQFFDTFPGATANPNTNPVCNQQLTANFQGKSVTVTVTDRCVGCAFGDIDLAPAAFNQLSDPAAGRLDGVTWTLS